MKVSIDFSRDRCSEKQWNFILEMCRTLNLSWEGSRPGFREASLWIEEHIEAWQQELSRQRQNPENRSRNPFLDDTPENFFRGTRKY